ncbi:MAG: nucleotidyltransferase family protein [Phycisphaerae bacterium]|nr:nucleotidyltransferase family protein [Phycisphaerae bacterium]
MEIQKDFKELLELLNSHKVEYLIVGGYALAYYGHPRFTGDMDILVKAEPENARRIILALGDFGFGSLDLSEDDLIYPGNVIQLGYPPVRIDLLTSISGVAWEEANGNKIQEEYGGVATFIIGKKEFIKNKKALGRNKDLADIESLDENE